MTDQPLHGWIVQINVNPRGGVPKHAVPSTTLGVNGVLGDKQHDKRHHGGPTRAVSLYAMERIEALQAEGHPITPGSTGENLTIAGIDWSALQIGDCIKIGASIEIEITDFASPCEHIAGSFSDATFTRISEKLYPGWSRLYARIIHAGPVHQGDPVIVHGRTNA
jgi:MOSC domain-containing protein YiiM